MNEKKELNDVPKGQMAYYDRNSSLMVIKLKNEAIFGFPTKLIPELENANSQELDDVAVSDDGKIVHCPT